MRLPLLLLLALTATLALATERASAPDAYSPISSVASRSADSRRPADSTLPYSARAGSGLVLASIAGLPPVAGTLVQSGGSVVFQPAGGGEPIVIPLFRTVGGSDARRAPAVRLLEVVGGDEDPVFLFHLGTAVVETATPGVLGQLVAEPGRVDQLGSAWTSGGVTLSARRDEAAASGIIHALVSSPYADSLFAVFGPPGKPIGIVDARGERAGRLGEYLPGRDSIALSPARMMSTAQLRHALAHELAHRWFRTHAGAARDLGDALQPIRDSLRYGFHDRDEHLAEAVAFAVHFLQASAGALPPASLLDSYERLVPGTRNAAALLLTFPAYERHPLARSASTPSD